MSTQAFLLEECENVKDLLDKTLRHDYGPEGSSHFFDECAARLAFIRAQLQASNPNDGAMLALLGNFLSELAALICRIERSSLGEYSWPFVDEVKKIADAICRENTASNADAPPKVYVFAEGGLTSYAIYTERRRPTASKQRLLTIVFPKSLKNFVLLHTILGHELGHAIWQCSKHQHTLKRDVLAPLTSAGVLSSPAATAAHLFAANAPADVGVRLAAQGISQASLFQHAAWPAWVEEILCDLVGLVTFGPGFVAAQCRLLYGVEPSGIVPGPHHPLVGWRVNMVMRGAKLLGYDRLPPPSSDLRAPMQNFWRYLDGFRKPDPWYDILTDLQLSQALDGVRRLLQSHPPAAYPPPSHGRIGSLVQKLIDLVPPVGHVISRDLMPKAVDVDFRHIIYAGWIATQHSSGIPFKRINQLCEHAIMQQRAIEIALRKGLQ